MAGVINKIRGKAYILLIIIGLAMVMFLFMDAFQFAMPQFFTGMTTPRDVIGEVAGEKIHPQYYANRIERDIAFKEFDGQQVDANAREQVNQQIWDNILQEVIYQKEYDNVGINLPDAEYQDMLVGPSPDPLVLQIFGSRENVSSVIKRSEQDQSIQVKLIQIEEYLQKNRKEQKYNNLIKAGLLVSKAEAQRKYNDENRRCSVSYLAVNYASIPDSSVQPQESDYREVYAEKKEEFRITQSQTMIKYIMLPLQPTAKDSAATFSYLSGLIEDFKKTQDDSLFASKSNRSDQVFNQGLVNPEELGPMVMEKVKGVPVDSVIGPFIEGNLMKLLKVAERKNVEDAPFQKIRHILIRHTPQDSMMAYKRALEVRAKVNTNNFMEICLQESDDKQTAMRDGGSLGWYVYGSFGPDFDAAIKKARKGEITQPIKSPQGYHIVEVQDRSTQAIRICTIADDIKPGSATLDSLRRKLEMFLSNVPDGKNFDEAAKKAGFQVMANNQPIYPGLNFISGLYGSGVKEIIRWALNGKENEVSKVIETDNAMVVATITQKMKEGYKPLDVVKEELKVEVLNRLKSKQIIEKLAKVKANDLEAMRASYGGGAFVSQADNVNFATTYIAGVGNDPVLLGNIFKLKANQTSNPIAAKTGVYVVKVNTVQEPNKLGDKELEDYRKGLQNNRKNQFLYKVQQGLREYAKVKDYRYNYGY